MPALIKPRLRRTMTFAAVTRRKIQQFGPYKSLAILLVPLVIVEPVKMAGLAFVGLGHWVAGACMIVGAYAAGLLVFDRLFSSRLTVFGAFLSYLFSAATRPSLSAIPSKPGMPCSRPFRTTTKTHWSNTPPKVRIWPNRLPRTWKLKNQNDGRLYVLGEKIITTSTSKDKRNTEMQWLHICDGGRTKASNEVNFRDRVPRRRSYAGGRHESFSVGEIDVDVVAPAACRLPGQTIQGNGLTAHAFSSILCKCF
jgi:hypothetical protein